MKKNITLALEDDLYDKVRVLAAMNRTSVSAMVRQFLEHCVEDARNRDDATEELLKLARDSQADFGSGPFVREEAYTGVKRFDGWR